MNRGILVVGSTALDSVETRHGKMDDVLGGSAFYFSAAASRSADVSLIGVVGEDFPMEQIDPLRTSGVGLEGLEVVPGGKTFRWGGRYHEDMIGRDTLFTELGVFEHFKPVIPQKLRQSELLFLANIQPALQLDVLTQMESQPVVITDTMNLWIDIALDDLKRVIALTNILIVNDEEARQITGCHSLAPAARALQEMGPHTVVIKKGEHGALLNHKGSWFSAPALPLDDVVDPTGAGDTFAGGFVSALATVDELNEDALRRAVIHGSAWASFCVEDFSLRRLLSVKSDELKTRLQAFRSLTAYSL